MRLFRVAVGVLFCAALFVVPGRYAVARYTYLRNFNIVDEGKLYRSGQLTPDSLGRVIHDHQIKTVISFRTPDATDTAASDSWEEDFCYKQGVRHFRVKPDHWRAMDDGAVPAQKPVDEFLALVKNPANHPVLVHCLRGVHRTGAYCAIYRMACQGWTNEEAMAEMKAMGYSTLYQEEDVREFMAHYVPPPATAKK